MKFACPCGAVLSDATDALPNKAHLVPDRTWHPLLDALDADVLAPLAAGKVSEDEAAMRLRRLVSGATRTVYQCPTCGRLHVNGPDGRLRTFAPDTPETSAGVLSAPR